MLILKRKAGERIRIELDPQLDPATPIGELFRDRAIEILVTQIDAACVKLGIDADARLLILRDELGPQQKTG